MEATVSYHLTLLNQSLEVFTITSAIWFQHRQRVCHWFFGKIADARRQKLEKTNSLCVTNKLITYFSCNFQKKEEKLLGNQYKIQRDSFLQSGRKREIKIATMQSVTPVAADYSGDSSLIAWKKRWFKITLWDIDAIIIMQSLID